MTTLDKPVFKSVPGDPIAVQMHTLSNGFRLFMSVNKDEPRVYTEIAVRAGSKHDPADTTGLAHYFEHMMFKGTDRLGSLDWPREKEILDNIERLFEAHRNEPEPEKKRVLYAEIDRLSFEAAKLAAANEYDKLVSAIGAKDTNAYTWVEQTVYVNDIPNNELERWFELESERFRRPILRLFHTELETVFEEYNISQDRDFRKSMKAMQEELTPTHPYGTQTTLGRGEDLKNPSQTNIYRFFERYYVPNNMAMVLCGDFNPEEAIQLAQRFFGHFEARPIPPFHFEPQRQLTAPVRRDVYGVEAPWVEIGWQLPGASTREALLLSLVSGILHNQQAGLFDLNLIQQQQVLEANAYPRSYEDYSSLLLYGKPREGQSLDTVEKLLLAEMDKLRKGEFEEWLPAAVVKDMKLSEMKAYEKNRGRASAITYAYVLGVEWADMVRRWEILNKVSKAEVVEFAKNWLRADNYVSVFKHMGEDKSVMKVEKPPITPIEVNRTDMSDFANAFLERDTPAIDPVFVDFKTALQKAKISPKVRLKVLQESKSGLFRLYYVFDMGKTADRRLALLASYVSLLGTDRYTPTALQQAFYQLGLQFTASCQDENFYLTLTGLPESFEAGVELLEHLLSNAQPEPVALKNLVADTLIRRENDKSDKRTVLNHAMANYAKYGPVSPYSDRLTKEQLQALQPEELVDLLRQLKSFPHELFYYGPAPIRRVAKVLKQYSSPETVYQALLPAKKYAEKGVRRDEVLFVNFPTVQVELLLISKGTPKFNLEEYVFAEWYNHYFGYGLSSIVFQEIRESKALAYSAYAYAGSPARKNNAHFLRAYVGTQPDKLREAIGAFQSILEEMPVSLPQMENARQSILKQIEADRLTKAELYWNGRAVREKGFPGRDLRLDVYQTLEKAEPADLMRFHQKHIKGRAFTWLVLGERERIDFEYLKKIGKIKEKSLEDIFGY